ncbi:fumarate hydratase FumD [Serratia marcescens]|nr:fumarate hydratase FumD [Serratia marcescens]
MAIILLIFKVIYFRFLKRYYRKNLMEVGMDYEEQAQIRYQEMCRIVGDVVFGMVAEGHETKKVAIADVIRTELAKGLDKWDEDQMQVMHLAVKLLEE